MKSFFTSPFSHLGHFAKAIWSYATSHKFIAGIAVVLILGGGYWAYASSKANATAAQYVLSQVTNAPIESTITASGEVAASHQLDLAPKASGEVTSVTVHAGDTVRAGQVIATIDSTDAQKTVRDAQLSLQSAQISYTQAVTSANTSITNSGTSVISARDSGFDAITSAEGQLATVTQDLKSLLLGPTDLATYQGDVTINAYTRLIDAQEPTAEAARDKVHDSYDAAVASYNQSFAAYQQASRTSSPQDVQRLITQVQDTTAQVNQAAKDAQTFFQLVNTTVTKHNLLKQPPSLSSEITSVNSYVTTINSVSSSLASAQSALTSALQTDSSNTQSISGGTPLAIQSAELSLAKARQTLADAQDALADYVVRAPFDGTIAQVDVQKYDQASGKVATLITTEQFADISLNETDIASLRVGQKATLTFDAIDDLTIDGTVAQVNQIGTVSQGVTTYDVKIGFDTQDARIRPGMTVNATIITASKDNALVIPISALKTQNGEHYVEVATVHTATSPQTMTPGQSGNSTTTRRTREGIASSTAGARFPAGGVLGTGTSSTAGFAGATRTQTVAIADVTITRVPVTIGIQSDTMTEITGGLSAGQQVVSQSLNASGTSTTQSRGLFGLFGGGTRTSASGGATRTGGGAGANTTFRASGSSAGFSGPPPAGG